MMEFWNVIVFELGGKPVLLIDILSAVFGLTTVFLAGRNNKSNFYENYSDIIIGTSTAIAVKN